MRGLAVLYTAIIAFPCQPATRKFPVSCEVAQQTLVAWLETRGFRATGETAKEPRDITLTAKRPRSARGGRIWDLGGLTRSLPEFDRVGGDDGCRSVTDVVGATAKLRFLPAAEGCSVSLVHDYLAREEYFGCLTTYGPVHTISTNAKLEKQYLRELTHTLGDVPPPAIPSRRKPSSPREQEVFFVANPAKRPSSPGQRPRDFEADLAGRRLEVVSVAGRERASRTPVVVVLDFGTTSFKNHACMAAEVAPLLGRIGRNTDFQVFVTGSAIGPFFSADFGLRNRRPSLLFSYPSREDVVRKCLAGYAVDNGSTLMQRAVFGGEAHFLLRSLALALRTRRGPHRVFWLSDSFTWANMSLKLDESIPPRGDEEKPTEEAFRRLATGFLENLSEAGITLFPVLLGRRTDKLEESRASARQRRYAAFLASMTGAFVTTTESTPGRTLERLLEATDDGYVFRLRAPVTGRRFWDGLPHVLNVVDRAANVRFRRGYTVGEGGQAESSEDALAPGVRLHVPSPDLRLVAGCPGESKFPSVAINLPQEVLTAPPSRLHILVAHSPEGGHAPLRQRVTLARPQVEPGRAGSPPLCFQLNQAHLGAKFSLIALDEGTEWLGALNGEVAR